MLFWLPCTRLAAGRGVGAVLAALMACSDVWFNLLRNVDRKDINSMHAVVTSGVSKIRICVLYCPVSVDVLLSPAHLIRVDANTDHGYSLKDITTYISQTNSFRHYCKPGMVQCLGSCPGSCSTNASIEHESSTGDVACQRVRDVLYDMQIHCTRLLTLHRPLHSVARVRLRSPVWQAIMQQGAWFAMSV
jgi:hypothetical protein